MGPIAVFDSGVGGLSVLRELVAQMPSEHFLYFGDSANAPYGTRPTAEIRSLTLAHAERLFDRGAKALVVACNTATSAAIGELRARWPDRVIIGIEPALKLAVSRHPGGCIGVLATEATLREEKFAALLQRCAENCHILKCPCPELVEFVERGELDSPALTAYLVMHCEPADRNLDGLLTLLSLADARDDPGYMSPLDMVFRELETGERYVRRGGASAEGGSLRGFSEEDGAWEWVKVREPAPPDDFALASYREFRVAAGDTMKSMLSSCNVRLKPLSIRAVRDLTSKDELDLAHMGDEGAKVALFASMSDTDSTFDFLFALLMDTAVSALCAEALEAHGGSLPTAVHFVFDEFANIGRIPDFERTIAVTRSRNIAVSMIAQSLSQLKETYGDNNAETIVNACDTLLYLGGKANETNEEISKMAGKQTVASETQSDSRGAGWTRTVNRGISERDLIQPAEVARMPREDALVLVNGCMPLMDRKYRLERHPRSRLLEEATRRGPFDFAEYRRRMDGAS